MFIKGGLMEVVDERTEGPVHEGNGPSCLVRWATTENGVVPPLEFVPYLAIRCKVGWGWFHLGLGHKGFSQIESQ